jgi:hypothetical protein
MKPLEGLFRANVIHLLVAEKFLPPERVQVRYSWKHSGFNLHADGAVPPEAKADLENLAQYILRNPFSVENMTLESPTDTVICRSRLNAKINRNFEVFTPHRLPGRHHPAPLKSEVRSASVETRPPDRISQGGCRFPNSSFAIRHLALPAATAQTPLQEMARPHLARLARGPAPLPGLPEPHARDCGH